MDTIFLEGIELSVRVGITEEERSIPQPCSLDIKLKVDLKEAGRSGELSKTIDYAALYAELERLCASRSFVLLEEIAIQAADLALRHPLAAQVRVRIRKLQPFTRKIKAVGVEIRKAKESGGIPHP
jgi:FolB domain-containing protein